MKLKERLLETFLKATSNLRTKKQVEWALHDIYATCYVLFLLFGFYAIATFSGWALLITMVIYLFLMYGFGWFEYKSREILLGYLYPDGFEEKEVQENSLNQLFAQVDNLIRELNED